MSLKLFRVRVEADIYVVGRTNEDAEMGAISSAFGEVEYTPFEHKPGDAIPAAWLKRLPYDDDGSLTEFSVEEWDKKLREKAEKDAEAERERAEFDAHPKLLEV